MSTRSSGEIVPSTILERRETFGVMRTRPPYCRAAPAPSPNESEHLKLAKQPERSRESRNVEPETEVVTVDAESEPGPAAWASERRTSRLSHREPSKGRATERGRRGGEDLAADICGRQAGRAASLISRGPFTGPLRAPRTCAIPLKLRPSLPSFL